MKAKSADGAEWIVLLRGVNVGRGRRVPTADFRGLLADLGGTEVRTLLNSGNAVLRATPASADALAAAVAEGLRARCGVEVPVIVKAGHELRAIVEANPMPPPEADHSRFLVAFAPDAAALRAFGEQLPVAEAPDRLAVGALAAYLHCPQGLLESPLGKAALGKAGAGVTTRNWATVLKLAAMLGAGSEKARR